MADFFTSCPGRPTQGAMALLFVLAFSAGAAASQTKPAGGIYSCEDDRGRRLTSDRPIPECTGKEQLLLNRDGSVRAVIPPMLTADERAEKELRDRKLAEARAAQQDAIRRDRNLLMRFPNEPAHTKAREAALEPLRLAIKNTETRLQELQQERKPLLSEVEFYVGKALPPRLREQIDTNQARIEAQRKLAADQAAELDRLNANYDFELERLRKLWAGALAGSLGPLPTQPVARTGSVVPAASR